MVLAGRVHSTHCAVDFLPARKIRELNEFSSPQTADKVSSKALAEAGALRFYGYMLKKPEAQQQELELVSIEVLVPAGTCCSRSMGQWISDLSTSG